jgi:hypothetical protein
MVKELLKMDKLIRLYFEAPFELPLGSIYRSVPCRHQVAAMSQEALHLHLQPTLGVWRQN